jgi:hypothetical protein
VAADVVAGSASDAAESASDAATDADSDADAGGVAAAAVEAAAHGGVCLGVGADPGAKRQLPSLKSAIVGAGEILSDPALSLLSAVNAVRYGTLGRARVTETVSWSGGAGYLAQDSDNIYGILAAGA